MLVLLLEFVVYAVEVASCDMIYLLSLLKIGTCVQTIIRFCTAILEAVMLVLLIEGIYKVLL
jgi:hypothetical protein